jgi:hypothetical protein
MTNGTISRRAVLSALPASGVALALPAAAAPAETDPILSLYREWVAALEERLRLVALPGNENQDSPECEAAFERQWAIHDKIIEMTPTSAAGIAAMAHLLFYQAGPVFKEGSPDYEMEMQHPENKMILAIWRAATGMDGLPRAI